MKILKKVVIMLLCIGVLGVNADAKDFTKEAKLVDAITKDANTCLSPFSLDMCLGMVANGASGDTKSEIEAYLGTKTSQYNKTAKSLLKDKTDELKIANSVWVTNKNNYEVTSEFQQKLAKYYNNSFHRVNFNKQTGVDRLNKWVNKRTDDKIGKVLTDPSSSIKMMLLNAIYFKSEWKNVYTSEDVKEADFTNKSGSISTVEYLCSEDSSYLENDKAYGVVRKYKNTRYEFIGILPKKSGNFKLADLDIGSLLDSKKKEKVYVRIPKFTVETDTTLNSTLSSKFNVKKAFTTSADFSKLCNSPLKIDTVRQISQIDVNENGTIAAAVTSIGMMDSVAIIDITQTKEIYLDRPFAYMIYDTKTKQILFMGKVVSFK